MLACRSGYQYARADSSMMYSGGRVLGEPHGLGHMWSQCTPAPSPSSLACSLCCLEEDAVGSPPEVLAGCWRVLALAVRPPTHQRTEPNEQSRSATRQVQRPLRRPLSSRRLPHRLLSSRLPSRRPLSSRPLPCGPLTKRRPTQLVRPPAGTRTATSPLRVPRVLPLLTTSTWSASPVSPTK